MSTIVNELTELKASMAKIESDRAALVAALDESKSQIEKIKADAAAKELEYAAKVQANEETVAQFDAVVKKFEAEAKAAQAEVVKLQGILAITPAAQDAQAEGQKPVAQGVASDKGVVNMYAEWQAMSDPAAKMKFYNANKQRINADFEKMKG